MVYYKIADEDGFLTPYTINTDDGGNCTEEEYNELADMIRNAEVGYGVKEIGGNLIYVKIPEPPEPDPDPEEALSILLGGVEA